MGSIFNPQNKRGVLFSTQNLSMQRTIMILIAQRTRFGLALSSDKFSIRMLPIHFTLYIKKNCTKITLIKLHKTFLSIYLFKFLYIWN